MNPDKSISDACDGTPEPERAMRNLHRLFEAAPDKGPFLPHLREIARLFSFSQSLANYSFTNPGELLEAFNEIDRFPKKQKIVERANAEAGIAESMDIKEAMAALRRIKKRYLLLLTLRDVIGKADFLSAMDDLTVLAEALLEAALGWSLKKNISRFGAPSGPHRIALIGLGKLGGAELNYSSDVDFVAVYDAEEGQTSGVLSPTGIRVGRTSNHEFYCKVVELLNHVLSTDTEGGIVYRVDLKLRPQGQKGEIALPLSAYLSYYESWGRTWERMALIRARPVAGDEMLGEEFMQAIGPFVWRKTLDYAEIEEIRALKKKIDSTLSKDDIKRGYGGIREVEFFVQTFQLLYGPENPALRTNRLLNAIQALRWMKVVPERDLIKLWENYIFLRRAEHYLQMKDDLQTHTLPSSKEDIEALGKKTGFANGKAFLSELRLRRIQIKSMYNSLLGTEKDIDSESLMLIEGDLEDNELCGYLSFRGVGDPDAALRSIKNIKENILSFKTPSQLSLIRKAVPRLLEAALGSASPDRAISGIEGFFSMGVADAHLTALIENKDLADGIIKVLAMSPYLRRTFLSDPLYLNFLIEEGVIRKTLKRMQRELLRHIGRSGEPGAAIAEYQKFEELRVGMFFLSGIIKLDALQHYLSHFAEAAIGAALQSLPQNAESGLSVIALGKLGGREMTFGSDIDIIFVANKQEDVKTAERLIKTLTSYTEKGIPYSVDLRLRPDGSKGILVNDLEGYENYYMKNAQGWEIQALLKARPVGGDGTLGRRFIETARHVMLKRSPELKRRDIQTMREKIIGGLSRESEGMDIKLGPGGIEEIEFFVQWLQLSRRMQWLLVPNTSSAIGRLIKKGFLNENDGLTLLLSYDYLRRLETFYRLNETAAVVKESDITEIAAQSMGYEGAEELIARLKDIRNKVLISISRN